MYISICACYRRHRCHHFWLSFRVMSPYVGCLSASYYGLVLHKCSDPAQAEDALCCLHLHLVAGTAQGNYVISFYMECVGVVGKWSLALIYIFTSMYVCTVVVVGHKSTCEYALVELWLKSNGEITLIFETNHIINFTI